jgi:hypothetical protein
MSYLQDEFYFINPYKVRNYLFFKSYFDGLKKNICFLILTPTLR